MNYFKDIKYMTFEFGIFNLATIVVKSDLTTIAAVLPGRLSLCVINKTQINAGNICLLVLMVPALT